MKIFDEYFSTEVFVYIAKETLKYAGSENGRDFSTDKVKLFILLFSGYHHLKK